jgi:hypothetical protein
MDLRFQFETEREDDGVPGRVPGRVIKDVDGGTLLLTRTTLTELTRYRYGPFRLELNRLRLRRSTVMIHATASALRSTVRHAFIFIDYDTRVIGCRTFGPAMFRKILKMADRPADAH